MDDRNAFSRAPYSKPLPASPTEPLEADCATSFPVPIGILAACLSVRPDFEPKRANDGLPQHEFDEQSGCDPAGAVIVLPP